jgi:hypothetical protein
MLRAFPMILIAILAYNALIFGGGAMGHNAPALLGQNFPVTVFSGDIWKISLGDGLTALALALLFVEVVKATRSNHRAILNHALSMLTFVAALVEFIVFKGFGTSTFFLITAMCLFDVVAGYTISIIAARRDMTIPGHEGH